MESVLVARIEVVRNNVDGGYGEVGFVNAIGAIHDELLRGELLDV